MIATHILQELTDIDTALLLAINGLHNNFWDDFMAAYSGKLIWIPFYATIFYIICRNFSWKTTLMCVVAIALTITFADQICSSLIRPCVERMRPSNLMNPISEYIHIVDGHRGGRYGFPSCHAANTFGLAFFISFLFRKPGLTAYMMGWALITCYSRMYLGVHYPGDLIAGAAVGCIGATLMYRLFAWASGYKRPSRIKQVYLPVWTGLLLTLGMLIAASPI